MDSITARVNELKKKQFSRSGNRQQQSLENSVEYQERGHLLFNKMSIPPLFGFIYIQINVNFMSLFTLGKCRVQERM